MHKQYRIYRHMISSFAQRIIICLVVALLPTISHAYEVQPLLHYLNITQGNLSSSIQVRNTSDQPLALDIASYYLQMEGDSPLLGDTAEDELLIFPPAALIAPGASQVIRLRWVPLEEEILSDQSFLVVVEQIPLTGGDEGVQVSLAFNAVVHVKAPGSQPDLEVETLFLSDNDGTPSLKIKLHNKGRGHAFGSQISLSVTWGNERREFSSVELATHVSDLFLPPEHYRLIDLPLPSLPMNSGIEAFSVVPLYRKP